jgi:flagellar export protein FliJ
MKKFEFKLSTVLKVRKKKEEEALMDLVSSRQAYQNEIDRRDSLIVALKESLKRREKLGKDPTFISEFKMEQDYITGTKQRIIQVEQSISRAKRTMEKFIGVYLQSKKQYKIIETLRDKAFHEYKIAYEKHLQKESDDFMIMRERLKEEIF